jgi:hypothetical protein
MRLLQMAAPPSAHREEYEEREQHRLQNEILILYESHDVHRLGSDYINVEIAG